MKDIPGGTITFLFTDIEGSTSLWEACPEAMQLALRQHDRLLRQAIETQDGYIFKTMGDAFCAAFASAPQALNAALSIQRSIANEAWPSEVGRLRVRTALHTGTAELRDGDYFGQTLNRAARLEAAAHGGQILLSFATYQLLSDETLAGIQFEDLGQHRLKDLFRPEHIFQVLVPGLPQEFPPLRTLEARRTNLPAQATPLIGRERELAAISALLKQEAVRLVTLSGPGGTGKTRLALQVAANLLDIFPDGVWFVDLSSLQHAALVVPAIASALAVKETGSIPVLDLLKEYLSGKNLLLVADNFEQVTAAGEQLAQLLSAAPLIKILVTSRQVLRLYGEHEYPVPALNLPEYKPDQTPEVLAQYEAVRLFLECARAIRPEFSLTSQNADAIVEICRRLDGLPLAIELAAARTRMLSVQAILARLSDRLKTLTGGAQNLPLRQQSLRAAIDWSYDLLVPDEQLLFARLGVFSGGWSLEAAEAVCAEGLSLAVMDGIESLLQKSLVRQAPAIQDDFRFSMLETLRAYALERLAQSADSESVRGRQAVYFARLVQVEAAAMDAGALPRFLERISVEYDNIRAALDWSLTAGDPLLAVRAVGNLSEFWWLHGSLNEGRLWQERAYRVSAQMDAETRASLAEAMSEIAFYQGRHADLEQLIHQAMAFHRQAGNLRAEAENLSNLGYYYKDVTGDLKRARQCFVESLAFFQRIDAPNETSHIMRSLALLALDEGQLEHARTYGEQALGVARQINRPSNLGDVLFTLAWVAFRQGFYDEARRCCLEAVEIAYQNRLQIPFSQTVRIAAMIEAADGEAEQSVRLFAYVTAFQEQATYSPMKTILLDQETCLAALRQKIDEETFAAAWAVGGSMTMDDAYGAVRRVLYD